MAKTRLQHGVSALAAALLLAGCAAAPVVPPSSSPVTPATPPVVLRGTGDLGLIIERAQGSVQIVEHSGDTALGRVEGLGDLSHAAAVFSRDGRYAYVFGRDGGLTKIDLLTRAIVKRVIQAGNSIGGAISTDGRVVAAQNYEPGGVKLFDAETLELLSEVSTKDEATGVASKVVGLADLPGNRFAFSLFEAGAIWVMDASNPRAPKVTKYPNIGKQPYDGLGSMNGRYYIAGLYGEDGLALLDLWKPEQGVRRILNGYGRGVEPLPVYKMPHLRGWAVSDGRAFFPAIGHNAVLVADTQTWKEVTQVPVAGQPVFAMISPDGRRVWVNFAFPNNDTVQVIDVPTLAVVQTMKPCKGVLHFEFVPRGEEVWLSCRDENRVEVYDTQTFARKTTLPADSPSGIFFTWRATRIGL
jgi:protein NirF